MKRFLIGSALALFSAGAAQAAAKVQFIPAHPGPCQGGVDQRSTQLSVVEVKETADAVQVWLQVRSQQCHDQLRDRPISQDADRLVTLLNDEFSWPWSARPEVGITTTLSKRTGVADIVLEFNKQEVLATGEEGVKSYRFIFAPEKMATDVVFEWQLELNVRPGESSRLRLTQKN